MAQFARPDGNITQTSFTGGFAEIDETIASDADFAYGANSTAAELEVSLTNPTDPQTSTGHIVRYRIAKTNNGTVDGAGNAVTITMRLMQGATQIATDATQTATGTWTTYTYTLSGAEADAITDYTDLRLEFTTSVSGGNPANRRGGAVSWAELEVPDAPTGNNYSQSFSTPALSFTGSVAKQARRALSASLGFSGTITRQMQRALNGGLGFTGGMSRGTSRSVIADVTFATAFSTNYIPAASATPALIAIHIHTE